MGVTSFRLDEHVRDELDFIKGALQTNQTEAIVEAIHAYYQILRQKKPTKSQFDVLTEIGFIGCFKGNRHLSTNYKEVLEKGWKKKHGIK